MSDQGDRREARTLGKRCIPCTRHTWVAGLGWWREARCPHAVSPVHTKRTRCTRRSAPDGASSEPRWRTATASCSTARRGPPPSAACAPQATTPLRVVLHRSRGRDWVHGPSTVTVWLCVERQSPKFSRRRRTAAHRRDGGTAIGAPWLIRKSFKRHIVSNNAASTRTRWTLPHAKSCACQAALHATGTERVQHSAGATQCGAV